MLAESSTWKWPYLADPLLMGCTIAFAVMYGGGCVLLRLTNSWTKMRHLILVTISTPLLFIPALAHGPLDPDVIILVIAAWLVIVVPLLFAIQRSLSAKVREDLELRWNLRRKHK